MQLNELDEYNCSNRCINGIFIDPLSDGRHEGWGKERVERGGGYNTVVFRKDDEVWRK